ncbi:MAG: hypothetical protein JNL12_00145 [Planctomycetes bacterium]|nr:hypothetical protein [Planctomycetota bacterium]
MHIASSRRLGLALVAGAAFLPSCTSTAPKAAAVESAYLPPRVVAQDPVEAPMSQVHPRTMATLGFAIGEQDFEVNTGSAVVSGSGDAFGFRLKGEHYLESDLGFHATVNYTKADDVFSGARSGITSTGIFLGLAYRATVDDVFRLPVRFGPFFHESEQEVPSGGDGDIERSTIGVRLAAEPEYIVFQQNEGGKIRELSVFAEVGCGAGPSDVKDNVDSEDGYSFNFNWEIGARYRMPSGLLVGLSYMAMKNHYGATETYNNPAIVFNGVDDDFGGFVITAGLRF